jgi:pimeloyl-ACP methyl ester carboxylesterase
MKKYIPKVLGLISTISPWVAAKVALEIFAKPIRTPRPESEKAWHESSKKYFLSKGIAAFEWGNFNDPLVMLIHGWNGRGTQLASFTKLLVENNFRVVALDGPGHGISAGKKTNPSHYAQFIIDAQKELLAESKQTNCHAVIAHSFGGGCTVLAASRGLKTNGLVLIASPAFYDRVVLFFARSINLNQKAEDYFIHMVSKLAGITPKELNIGLLGSKINLPALIVHDEDDNAVDYLSAKAIAEAWPQSILLTTSGLGHRRILKDQSVIHSVVNFILTLGV